MTRDHSLSIPSHDFSAGAGAESCSQQTHTDFPSCLLWAWCLDTDIGVKCLYVDAAVPGMCARPCMRLPVRTGCLEHNT